MANQLTCALRHSSSHNRMLCFDRLPINNTNFPLCCRQLVNCSLQAIHHLSATTLQLFVELTIVSDSQTKNHHSHHASFSIHCRCHQGCCSVRFHRRRRFGYTVIFIVEMDDWSNSRSTDMPTSRHFFLPAPTLRRLASKPANSLSEETGSAMGLSPKPRNLFPCSTNLL